MMVMMMVMVMMMDDAGISDMCICFTCRLRPHIMEPIE